MEATIQGQEDIEKKSKERLMTATNNSNIKRNDSRTNREWTKRKTRKKTLKKINYMDTSSTKVSKLKMRWHEDGYEEEISKEKLN